MNQRKLPVISFNQIIDAISKLVSHKKDEAILIGISGIDASGKGYVSHLIRNELQKQGITSALIGLDPWHHPKTTRLNKRNAALNFYENAFRWNDLFEKLILPLKQNGSVNLKETLIQTDDDIYFEHQFHYHDIDVILLEGIFLFKKEFQHLYDYKIWIECDFKTALNRAKERNQEKAGLEILVKEYLSIYFPAQEIHLQTDDVLNAVNAVFVNCSLEKSKRNSNAAHEFKSQNT